MPAHRPSHTDLATQNYILPPGVSSGTNIRCEEFTECGDVPFLHNAADDAVKSCTNNVCTFTCSNANAGKYVAGVKTATCDPATLTWTYTYDFDKYASDKSKCLDTPCGDFNEIPLDIDPAVTYQVITGAMNQFSAVQFVCNDPVY